MERYRDGIIMIREVSCRTEGDFLKLASRGISNHDASERQAEAREWWFP